MSGVIWPYQQTAGPRTANPVAVRKQLEQIRKNNPAFQEDFAAEIADLKEDYEDALRSKRRGEKLESYEEGVISRNSNLMQNRRLGIRTKGLELKLAQDVEIALQIRHVVPVYSIIQEDHVLRMAGAIINLINRSATIPADAFASAKAILDLTLEFFFPSNVLVKKKGFSQREPPEHAVISGHGMYCKAVAPFRVPPGKQIYFYCALGNPLLENVGQSIESVADGGAFAIPLEIKTSGDLVQNHFLAYPGGYFSPLTINAKGRKGGVNEMIINRNPWRLLSLGELLEKDPRCKNATHIHWCACRNEFTNDKLKSKGMVFDPPRSITSEMPRLIVRKQSDKTFNQGYIQSSGATQDIKLEEELNKGTPIVPRFGT